LLIALGVAVASAEDKTIKLLVEISRHGARAPKKIYNFTADPADNFVTPYNLTETGAQMHYSMGQWVRSTYVDFYKFLSPNYDPKETYIQSTDRARTIDSARSQVSGIYDKPLVWPNVETQFPVNVISDPVDYVIHLTDDLCSKFG
jgi:hypothetical protein